MKKKLTAGLLAVLLALGMAQAAETGDVKDNEKNVTAQSSDTAVYMPDISEKEKSLEITYTFAGNAISGAEISIYKIVDVSVKGGRTEYSFTDEYTAYAEGTDFETLTTEESIELAGKIDTSGKEETQKAVTDEAGRVTFTGLDDGMYLVVQSGKSGAAAQYETFGRYLVAVPYAETGEETDENGNRTGTWIDSVACYPKTETTKIPTEPETPKTGDSTAIRLLTALAAVSAGALLFGGGKRRKKKEKGK